MQIRALVALTTCAVLLGGCDNLAANPSSTNTGTVALQALPRSVAGPPETINVPRRVQRTLQIVAFQISDHVQIYSKSPWHGRRVRVYYVPPQNTAFDRDHYDLRSTANLQKIAEVPVAADGSWKAIWRYGNTHIRKTGLFLMARSDIGEIGLVQVRHVQKW